MIITFEDETFELTEPEKDDLVPEVIRILEERKPFRVKSAMMERILGERLGRRRPKGATIRKVIHYIRVNGLAMVLGDGDGYFISDHPDDVEKCITSLRQRGRSIFCAAEGLNRLRRGGNQKELWG